MNRPMPVSVPPEPTPTTTASTSPSIWRRISGPVVVSCARGLAGLPNWSTKKAPGVRSRDRRGEVLVIVRMPLADVRARDDDLGAHRLGVQHLLARHLVGHHQQRAIALAPADQREAEPGIAGGRLDDGAAGLEPAVGFRRLDHGARRPVLDRARRVRAFELEKQPAGPALDARHLHERRVADEIEDRSHGGHHRSSTLQRLVHRIRPLQRREMPAIGNDDEPRAGNAGGDLLRERRRRSSSPSPTTTSVGHLIDGKSGRASSRP